MRRGLLRGVIYAVMGSMIFYIAGAWVIFHAL